MSAFNKPIRIARAAAWITIPVLALALSISGADAKPKGYRGNGQGNGHGNGHGYTHARVAAGPYYGRPHVPAHGYYKPYHAYAPYSAYVPYRAYRPYPVYSPYAAYAPYTVYAPYGGCAAPVVRAYPVAPVPYGSVVIDSYHGNVGGFVGLAGPNFSLGFGF